VRIVGHGRRDRWEKTKGIIIICQTDLPTVQYVHCTLLEKKVNKIAKIGTSRSAEMLSAQSLIEKSVTQYRKVTDVNEFRNVKVQTLVVFIWMPTTYYIYGEVARMAKITCKMGEKRLKVTQLGSGIFTVMLLQQFTQFFQVWYPL